MEDLLKFAIFNIPAVICLIAGVILCIKEKEGWGWFLFVALILSRFPGIGQ